MVMLIYSNTFWPGLPKAHHGNYTKVERAFKHKQKIEKIMLILVCADLDMLIPRHHVNGHHMV